MSCFSFFQAHQYRHIFDQFLSEYPHALIAEDLVRLLPLFGPSRSLTQCQEYILQFSTIPSSPPSLTFDDFLVFLASYHDIVDEELEKVRRAFDEFAKRYGRGVGKEAFLRMIKAGTLPLSDSLAKSILDNYFHNESDLLSSHQFVDIVKKTTAWVPDLPNPLAVEGPLTRKICIKILSVCNISEFSFPWPFPLQFLLSNFQPFLVVYLAGKKVSTPVVLDINDESLWKFQANISFELPAKLRTAQQWVEAQNLTINLMSSTWLYSTTVNNDSNSELSCTSTRNCQSELIATGQIPLSWIMLYCTKTKDKTIELSLSPVCSVPVKNSPKILLSLSCSADDVAERRQSIEVVAIRRFKKKSYSDLSAPRDFNQNSNQSESQLFSLLNNFSNFSNIPQTKSKLPKEKQTTLDNTRLLSSLLSSTFGSGHVMAFPPTPADVSKFFPKIESLPKHPESYLLHEGLPEDFSHYYSLFSKEVKSLASKRNFIICAFSEFNQFNPIFSFIYPIYTDPFYRDSELFTAQNAAELIARITTLSRDSDQLDVENPPLPEQIMSPLSCLQSMKGSQLSKAIFLCNLLLGLKIEAFVACGTDKFAKPCYWVISREKKRSNKNDGEGQKSIDDATSELSFKTSSPSKNQNIQDNILIFHHYLVENCKVFTNTNSPNFPYITCGCLFNQFNSWINIQQSNRLDLDRVDFDLSNGESWLPFLTATAKQKYGNFPPLYENPSILIKPPRGSELCTRLSMTSFDILSNLIVEYRTKNFNITTYFSKNLSQYFNSLCRHAFTAHRYNILKNENFKTEAEESNKVLQVSNISHYEHVPKFSVLNFKFLTMCCHDVDTVFKKIIDLGIIDCKGDVVFGLGISSENLIGKIHCFTVVIGYSVNILGHISCSNPINLKTKKEFNSSLGASLSLTHTHV
ncbi:hypothetical protein RCL1_007214 [Eukaryota sp. TZLM3-RCL]